MTCGVMKVADVLERVRLNRLLDVYGPLLTEHRREVVRLYCEEDLSLGEIAEQLEITRQGVGDAVSKARQQLEDYENKLGIAEQEKLLRSSLEKCMKALMGGETEAARMIIEDILKER